MKMTDLRKAAEQALEFVEWFASDDHSVRPQHKAPEVVEALRQALAQPEHEPVAWQDPQYKTLIEPHKAYPDWIPLYTAPPISDYHEGWEEGFKAAKGEQEPVGYVTIENISSWAQVPSIKWFKKPTEGPLYTAPPKREWVGLTDDEIIKCFDSVAFGQVEDDLIINKHVNIFRAIHIIEAKLKEKNT